MVNDYTSTLGQGQTEDFFHPNKEGLRLQRGYALLGETDDEPAYQGPEEEPVYGMHILEMDEKTRDHVLVAEREIEALADELVGIHHRGIGGPLQPKDLPVEKRVMTRD
ncbi:MAG: hypothetical protein H6502_01505 [Candidatus Woesearchaeota archaeon]|nr:MAG: hypothetical protein H6502_01505 [Candidatus Woesearchaeota archaeon]